MTVTVITPTIRPLGLEIVKKGLDRQTIPYDEWLVGSPEDYGYGKWVKDAYKGGFWSFGRISNQLLKQAKGDLIVSVQDYTFINPQALEKFAFYNKIVSGIGDKYDSVYPLGNRLWTDPRRATGKGFRECNFALVEGNFCAFPKQAVIDMGGFDESLDFLGYGLDFYSLWDRMDMKGYKFFIDDTNESFSLAHDRAKDWDEKNIKVEQYREKREEYLKNPVLSYL